MLTYLTQVQRHLRVSLFVSIAIVFVEFVGGILSNSLSLISDAVHVLSDVLAIALSLFAVTLATRQHKGSMTYGYHRAEVLAALTNGILLCAISVWIFFEAYHRMFSPRLIDVQIVIGIAAIGLAGNIVIMRILKRDLDKSLNVRSAFSHIIYDLVSSIAVIFVGIITYFTGLYVLDPLIAFFIGAFIARSGYIIVKESVHILLEGAPAGVNIQEIQDLIKKMEEVIDVHDLHIWTITTGMNALSGHIVVADQMLSHADKLVQTINKALVERYGINHTTLQVEPEKKELSFKHNGASDEASKNR